MTPGPFDGRLPPELRHTAEAVPVVGRVVTVLRWEVVVVVKCERCGQGTSILHSNEAQACLSCGLMMQFVCFQHEGKSIMPGELNLSLMGWQPPIQDK